MVWIFENVPINIFENKIIVKNKILGTSISMEFICSIYKKLDATKINLSVC